MYTLKTSAAFDSAHFLHGYDGRCANIHGHHWVVEVKICGGELNASGDKKGMLIDFTDFKKAVKELADGYDHALIYEENTLKEKTVCALKDEGFLLIPVPFRPTAENFARSFFVQLKEKGLPVAEVAVYESPDNCAAFGE